MVLWLWIPSHCLWLICTFQYFFDTWPLKVPANKASCGLYIPSYLLWVNFLHVRNTLSTTCQQFFLHVNPYPKLFCCTGFCKCALSSSRFLMSAYTYIYPSSTSLLHLNPQRIHTFEIKTKGSLITVILLWSSTVQCQMEKHRSS